MLNNHDWLGLTQHQRKKRSFHKSHMHKVFLRRCESLLMLKKIPVISYECWGLCPKRSTKIRLLCQTNKVEIGINQCNIEVTLFTSIYISLRSPKQHGERYHKWQHFIHTMDMTGYVTFWFWEIPWTLRGCPESSKSKRFVDRPRILWKRTRFLLTLGHPEIRAPGNQTEPIFLINENHFPPVGIGCRHLFSSNLGQDIFFDCTEN